MSDAHYAIRSMSEERRGDVVAAGLGGAIGGIIGPLIGATVVIGQSVITGHGFEEIADSPFAYLMALVVCGIPGFVVGAIGGFILRRRSANVGFSRLIFEGVALGFGLSALVPFGSWALGWGGRDVIRDLLPIALTAGVSCSIILVLLLRRCNLLGPA